MVHSYSIETRILAAEVAEKWQQVTLGFRFLVEEALLCGLSKEINATL